MRKIKTMADIERIRKRNNIILGVAMITLLVGSSLGYSLMSADNKNNNNVKEGNFEFFRDAGMWKLSLDGEIFGFRNLPSELGDIDVDLSTTLDTYNGKPLYFVNSGEGVNEILANLDRYILRYQQSCLDKGTINQTNIKDASIESMKNEITCKGNLPVKDCNSNLIIFETGNETRVYSEGNCIFISGDQLKGSDAFLYKILGIN